MRAEVVVVGVVANVDLWPYSEIVGCIGPTTVLTVKVHDSRELIGVLRGLLARGLEVRRAQLHHDAVPIGWPDRDTIGGQAADVSSGSGGPGD